MSYIHSLVPLRRVLYFLMYFCLCLPAVFLSSYKLKPGVESDRVGLLLHIHAAPSIQFANWLRLDISNDEK